MKKLILLITIMLFLFLIVLYPKGSEQVLSVKDCENITAGRLKIVCYNLFSRNYSYCKLAQDFSNYCYDSVFPLMKMNESFCLSFTENYQKISCLVALSAQSKNPNVCSLLEDSSLSSACYARLIEYLDYFNGTSFCYNISHESTRFLCIAKKTDDIGYCYNITSEIEERNGCLGILTKNMSYCKIETTGAISKITLYSCIKDIASKLNDLKMCDEINEDEGKWECKAAVSKDERVCDEASDPWRDFCRLEFIKTQLTKKYLWNS
jgi:hypothetical protein